MDFGIDSADPMAAMGGGASPYMKDLAEKLTFIKAEVLSQYNIPDIREWCVRRAYSGAFSSHCFVIPRILPIVKYTIKTFVLHVSIVKPLSESGKLQLTSDMTELEFSLSAFMADKAQVKRGVNWESIGDEYRTLRAMR